MVWASSLPLTVVSGGEVPAALALSGLRVAVLAVLVAVAAPAVWEAPEAGQAVRALPSRGTRGALTLSCSVVAEGADRAPQVALTS